MTNYSVFYIPHIFEINYLWDRRTQYGSKFSVQRRYQSGILRYFEPFRLLHHIASYPCKFEMFCSLLLTSRLQFPTLVCQKVWKRVRTSLTTLQQCRCVANRIHLVQEGSHQSNNPHQKVFQKHVSDNVGVVRELSFLAIWVSSPR